MRVSLYCMAVATLIAITGIFLTGLGCIVGPSLLAPAGNRGVVLLLIDAGASAFVALGLIHHARSPSAHSEDRKQQEAAARVALVGLALVVVVLVLVPYLFIPCTFA